MGKLRRLLTNELLFSVLLVALLLPVEPCRAQTGSQGSVIHSVAWGETLFSIAQRYGSTVDAISRANSLADPTHIYAGQRLVIPSTQIPAAPPNSASIHVVQPGENLFRIAVRYGVTVKSIVELNGLYNPDQVRAGQELSIPGSAIGPSLSYQPQHASTTHTVRAGETLSAIAHQYGVSLWTLVQINNIGNTALILPGQTLTIPRASSLASPPGSGPAVGKRIVIDLSDQHLVTYQGGVAVHSFVVSTGMAGMSTVPGTYQVLDKYPNAYASTWSLQMPYWLGIYWAGSLENGIHALPILPNGQRLWAGYLGTPVSYGCVILDTEAARTLYNWAEVGTPVVIQY